MLTFFLITLIVLLFIYLTLNKFDVVNPAILYLSSWILSASVAAFSFPYWGLSLSTESTLLQIIFIFCSTLPCIILGNTQPITKHAKEKLFYIPTYKLCFVALYLFISHFWILSILSEIALSHGYNPNTHQMGLVEFIRYESTNNETQFSFGKIFPQLTRINFALGCVLFYFFTQQLYNHSQKKFLNQLFLFCLSLVCLYLSTYTGGRTAILAMIIAYLSFFLLEYSRNIAWKNNRKMLPLVILLTVFPLIFLSLFVLIGIFVLNRFHDGSVESIISNIALYISSPLATFSTALVNLQTYPTLRFGEYTFNSVYGTLKTLGFIDSFASVFLPGITIDQWNSNVYTAHFRYILDFGITGTIILTTIIGVVIGLFYRYIKQHNINNIYIISLYSLIMYGFLMTFFEAQLFINLNDTLFRWLFIILIYLILRTSAKQQNI